MTIKHLVISSGGPCGFLLYGAAKYMERIGMWKRENIETMYGCSVGAWLSIMFSLGYDWDTMDDYLIKRPWDKVFLNMISHKDKLDRLLSLIKDKGVVTLSQFTDTIRPLLVGKDLPLTINMKEFYDYTKIELHFVTCDINKFELIDLSHKTHPTLSLVEAAYMSCSIPYVFQPIIRDGRCYVDGAVYSPYPIDHCFSQTGCKPHEILGLNILWERDDQHITENTGVFQYFIALTSQLSYYMYDKVPTGKYPYQVICMPDNCKSLSEITEVIKDAETRKKLIKRGEVYAKIFMSHHENVIGTPTQESVDCVSQDMHDMNIHSINASEITNNTLKTIIDSEISQINNDDQQPDDHNSIPSS
jgi:predicted acylesterase/phospholipase RssA